MICMLHTASQPVRETLCKEGGLRQLIILPVASDCARLCRPLRIKRARRGSCGGQKQLWHLHPIPNRTDYTTVILLTSIHMVSRRGHNMKSEMEHNVGGQRGIVPDSKTSIRPSPSPTPTSGGRLEAPHHFLSRLPQPVKYTH